MRTIAVAALLLMANAVCAENILTLKVSSKGIGLLRPLHGGNGGVLCDGGLTDLSSYFKDVRVPLTRLHDCHWPNADVVDMHVVFPNPQADPSDPASYDFRRTDEYIKAIRATGSQIVYRLGESIEHTAVKYHVHPPTDASRWAAACLGIVRHYQDSVQYWEIWNEPENRPAMWSGSDEDYLKLYQAAATAIKKEFPRLKIGGPALGYSGKLTRGGFEPSPFLLKFLQHCQSHSLPLDFFSWHLYSDDPAECVARARGIRQVLDQFGFKKTESHLNEWNYLPKNDWRPVALAGQGQLRKKFNEELAGPSAAAFVASVLINLQEAPVDQANIFRADNGGFGLFDPAAAPNKPYFAFKAFSMLLETPLMLQASGAKASEISLCAGINSSRTEVNVLISNYRSKPDRVVVAVDVPWSGQTQSELFQLDATHELSLVKQSADKSTTFSFDATAPYVYLIRLKEVR